LGTGRTVTKFGALPWLIFLASLAAFFPLSWQIARPLATFPWKPEPNGCFLLILTNRIDLRPTAELPHFSPRPSNAQYSFLIPPERREWVLQQLRRHPTPTAGASWHLLVRTIDANTQEIELELLGDGFYGVVYRATSDTIVPVKIRDAGPGFAFVILGIDLAGAILVSSFALLTIRWLRIRRSEVPAAGVPG